MRAVTFQAPGEVSVDERPDPEPAAAGDAVVEVSATAICGSDLHIYHGRHPVEPGFTIGHEFVGTVVETGDGVGRVAAGDRVLGCFFSACGECFFCHRGEYPSCESLRIFGHGEISGALQGSQADRVLVPNADLILRRVPDGISDDVALFAGDVMGTAVHGVRAASVQPGESVAILGLGPVGLCAVQAARAAGVERILAVDTIEQRLELARAFGAEPIHLTEQDPVAEARAVTDGRGVDACVECVGDPRALELAIRLARKTGRVSVIGVHGARCEVHMGLLWNKSLTLTGGPANVIAHVDDVLERISDGSLDPSPIVTHHMALEDAAEAYEIYDRREALKIVLTP